MDNEKRLKELTTKKKEIENEISMILRQRNPEQLAKSLKLLEDCSIIGDKTSKEYIERKQKIKDYKEKVTSLEQALKDHPNFEDKAIIIQKIAIYKYVIETLHFPPRKI